jgi:DNA topoisomerase-1
MNNYFLYENLDKNKLSEEDEKRIKYLRIPPNWNSVKINKDASDKIQVTGMDAKGRMQYIYHPAWVLFSKDTKYSKVNSIDFTLFDSIIKRYSNFNDSYSKNYIISNMFILMKDLNIRVGNEKYLEENDSVGLCTLSKSHYKKISENKKIVHKLIFKGKKGVLHEKILSNNHIKFIENIIKIPGSSLFKYQISNKTKENYKKVTADDLNQFLKDYVDKDMSCKDVRTFCANNIFKKEYATLIKNGLNNKKARIEAMKITAKELGNTPKVCKDSYIDPELYED